MKICVISDSHDNVPNIDTMLEYCQQHNLKHILHCGDICVPGVIKHLAEHFAGHIDAVLGNVHAEIEKMDSMAESLQNFTLHGEQAELIIDGKKIAVNHYPQEAQKLAESGRYDVIFYGHDHKAWTKKIGNTLLFNPGTLAGLFAKPTFAVYDTAQNTAELILVETLVS